MTSLPRRQTLTRLGAGAAGLLLPAAPLLAQTTVTTPSLDVPYVPTPQEVVERMLQMAKVGKNDVLFDLGCGDGRIVVTAAKSHGARGTGIDLDSERIGEARKNAQQAGVADKVSFKVADLFETDVSAASVVTLYLLPNVNTRLRPQLWKQLKVGSRVVSHAFDMGPEWPPEKTESVEGRTIYYWTIKQAHKKAAKA
ncbi:cyclopropane-fatty-acyl-phospholipid synthase family protein [Massilia sp. Leaf139]|uniref:SAM-dependent methyltransferase n=1 Tax=Massilia sp. Leaf139 TaxID=1736272 RepID=UPI0006FCAAB0|nr:class I SAM-dependent methyltransferase [Massilia sp. Leaf139]KQQ97269.1 SAM-dependent methyltransferase [Massilia sp. Leaf139]